MKSVVDLARLGGVLALTLAAASLAAAPREPGAPVPAYGPAADYPVTLGDPFTLDGVTYTPVDTMNYDAVGYAVAGAGEGVSGAHRTLPLPSYVEVTALDSGKTVLVRLSRRGPMQGDGLIELSPAAMAQLGMAPGARAPVRVRRVNPPEDERVRLRMGQEAPPRMDTPPGLLAALKRKLGIAPPPPVDEAVTEPAVPPVDGHRRPVPTTRPAVIPPRPVGSANPPMKSAPGPQPASTAALPPAPAAGGAEPRPSASPAQKPMPTSTTASPAAPARLFVQVGAFSTAQRAATAARQVDGKVVRAGRYWRVQVPVADRNAADAALARARRAGYADARILPAK